MPKPTTSFQSLISSSIQASIATKERLLAECAEAIGAAGDFLASTLENGGKILLCGNGGSAADAQHIAAELVIRYRSGVNRRALPALALARRAAAQPSGAFAPTGKLRAVINLGNPILANQAPGAALPHGVSVDLAAGRVWIKPN